MDRKSTFLLGVTGGMGAGKTLACKFLENRGALIFNSDKAARQAMVNDKMLMADLKNEFGSQIFHSPGELNVSQLADIVFSSPEKLKRLNSLVHPYVFELFKGVVQLANQQQKPMLVKEAALIYETGAEVMLDAVLVIDAPHEVKIKRILERNGWTRSQIEQRMSFQFSATKLIEKADYVIANDGSVEDLEMQVNDLYDKIIREAN